MATATNVTLKDIASFGNEAVTSSEETMAEALEAITDGDTVTTEDLLRYQVAATSNSLTVSIISSSAKERGDTLKGIVQKF